MASPERPIANVLGNIADDIREIVKAEVRLARRELTSEIAKVKGVAPLLIVGAAAGSLAGLFLAWTAFFALAIAIPMWAAALVVAVMLAGAAGMAAAAAFAKLQQVNAPERTIASVKENVEWIKGRTE